MEEIKKILSPTISLLKELNVKLGKEEVDGDFVLKIATAMKVSAIGLEKHVKSKKLNLSGGLIPPSFQEEDE